MLLKYSKQTKMQHISNDKKITKNYLHATFQVYWCKGV